MAAPNFANINANPALFLTWLNDNLLLPGYLTNVPHPGLSWVTIALPVIIPGLPPHAVNASGRPLDIFAIRSNVAGAGPHNAVHAYVCNYTANQVEFVDLGGAANYCFTTTMNGCTFGIGPLNAGIRRVSHANAGGNSATQRTQTWGAHGVAVNSAAISMLEPSEYRRGGNLNATTFGIRTGGVWQFYYQIFNAIGGGNYQVLGVIPIRVP